jgi:hypothetical protein
MPSGLKAREALYHRRLSRDLGKTWAKLLWRKFSSAIFTHLMAGCKAAAPSQIRTD